MSCSIWSRANSYTHDNMIAIRDAAAVRRELVDSKRVIEDLFGREVIGFTAPGASATASWARRGCWMRYGRRATATSAP